MIAYALWYKNKFELIPYTSNAPIRTTEHQSSNAFLYLYITQKGLQTQKTTQGNRKVIFATKLLMDLFRAISDR